MLSDLFSFSGKFDVSLNCSLRDFIQYITLFSENT